MQAPIDYLNPALPAGLRTVTMPVVTATAETLGGYGRLVDDPNECRIEIVRWPAQGSRPVDADTGDQGGTTEGVFISDWHGDVLYGRNEAVGGHYVLAYAQAPERARTDHADRPRRMLIWHANYHPTVASCSFRSTAGRSMCRWRCRATTSRPSASSASGSTAARASTSIRTSGTKASSG